MTDGVIEEAGLTALGLHQDKQVGNHCFTVSEPQNENTWWQKLSICDMIKGFYYIESMSLAPAFIYLPRNIALRTWVCIAMNNISHVA